MPNDYRLDKENVVHIHHGILWSHKKEQDHIFAGDLDGAESHYPQQTNTETDNQTPHVLTYEWELNDENTWTHGGGTTYTGACWKRVVGEERGIAWGEKPYLLFFYFNFFCYLLLPSFYMSWVLLALLFLVSLGTI